MNTDQIPKPFPREFSLQIEFAKSRSIGGFKRTNNKVYRLYRINP